MPSRSRFILTYAWPALRDGLRAAWLRELGAEAEAEAECPLLDTVIGLESTSEAALSSATNSDIR